MSKVPFAAFAAALFALSGCGDSDQPSSPPSTGNGQTITGRERIGWTQSAASSGDFALFDYALYVDGNRRVLEGDSCTATAVDTMMDCSAPLPSMSAGQHTLELAVFVQAGETMVESPRSPPLQVTVAALTAPVDELGATSDTIVSTDGITLRVETVARELTEPVDVAAAPDGRLFIAERSGRIVVTDTARSGPTHSEHLFERVLRESPASLASLSLSRDFTESGIVHLAYVTTRDRRGAVVRLARVRERGGTFGEAAVLASHPVPDNASALVRTGPDGALYVGIGTGADVEGAQRLTDAAGKILRLRSDGSTPDDNPWQSPVFSVGHRDPSGLAWQAGGALWEVEADDSADELNVVRAGANYGWPVANGVARHPRVMSPALLLPAGTQPSGLTAVTAPASPFHGDLIVSALAGEDLLRLRPDAAGQMQVAGLLLQRRFGRIRQVTSGADGALFAITGNAGTWGMGQDIAIRLVPASARLLTLPAARR